MIQIIPNKNLVFLSENEPFEIDCSIVSDVEFIGIDGENKWVEYKPFTGRVTSYDWSKVDSIIAEAQAKQNIESIKQNPPSPSEHYYFDEESVEWVFSIDLKVQDIKNKLERIDSKYHSDRSWREYVINNPAQFSTQAVDRMQQAENEAQLLRDELATLT